MSSAFKHPLIVRFFDVDMLGHVNNAVYFTYLEEARMGFFTSMGYEAKNFQKECPVILAHAECDYLSPCFLNEKLDIILTIKEIRNASFTIEYEMKEHTSQRLIAKASTVLVTFDYHLKKVIPIPKSFREKLSSFLKK